MADLTAASFAWTVEAIAPSVKTSVKGKSTCGRNRHAHFCKETRIAFPARTKFIYVWDAIFFPDREEVRSESESSRACRLSGFSRRAHQA